MKIFFAAPFTSLLSANLGFSSYHQQLFEAVLNALTASGHRVFSAHVREEWGKKLLTAEQLVPDDYKALLDADLVLTHLVEPISQGVLIELGWASAHRKPIVLITKSAESYSPMIYGLRMLTNVWPVNFEGGAFGSLIADLNEAVKRIASERRSPL